MTPEGQFYVKALNIDNFKILSENNKLITQNTFTDDKFVLIDPEKRSDFFLNYFDNANYIISNNQSYFLYNEYTVTIFLDFYLDINGVISSLQFPLPRYAKDTSIGSILIKDPNDTNFHTNMGSIYINTTGDKVVLQSNLFNKKYCELLHINGLIHYPVV